MDKIIKLRGRYSIHKLKQLKPVNGGESKTYKLVLGDNDDILRMLQYEDGTIALDPSGGPMLSIGTNVKGHIIKEIKHSMELGGYLIIFE